MNRNLPPKSTETLALTKDLTPRQVLDLLVEYARGHAWLPDKRGMWYSVNPENPDLAVLCNCLSPCEDSYPLSEVFRVRKLESQKFQIEYIEVEGLPKGKTLEDFTRYVQDKAA